MRFSKGRRARLTIVVALLVGIALGAGSVWVIKPEANTVIRVDPVTLHVLKIIRLPGTPSGIAFDDGVVWVSITTAYPSSGGIAQPHPHNLLR